MIRFGKVKDVPIGTTIKESRFADSFIKEMTPLIGKNVAFKSVDAHPGWWETLDLQMNWSFHESWVEFYPEKKF